MVSPQGKEEDSIAAEATAATGNGEIGDRDGPNAPPEAPEPFAPDTPMWRQYLSLKAKHPRDILFFRMGDFYEMFFDDAKIASEILGITLTSRSKDPGGIPMAGVPVRAVDTYLPRLLEAGRRVAIAEQMQDPSEAKGLVEREVVRVVTPGTVTDEKLVDDRSNNFLVAVVPDHNRSSDRKYGVAWLDVNTGLFQVWESSSANAMVAELARLNPAECLVPEGLGPGLEGCPELRQAIGDVFRTPYPDWAFDPATARRALTDHFRTRTLDGFGCEHHDTGVRAAGGLLQYVRDTQKTALRHITRLGTFTGGAHVPLDRTTQLALEISETYLGRRKSGTLLRAFDQAVTAMGARKLRGWLLAPLTEIPRILQRQDAIGEAVEKPELLDAVRELLREVQDLERLASRLSYGSASPRDLSALGRSLAALPRLRALLEPARCTLLREHDGELGAFAELATSIEQTLDAPPPAHTRDGGVIRPGFSPELDELRRLSTDGSRWLSDFQGEESRRTGIAGLKVGYTRVFGYYIEITNANAEKVPLTYIRKQTLKNCERYITPELKEHEARVLGAREQALSLEEKLFDALRDEAACAIPAIQTAADAVARVDALTALAHIARQRGYTRPTVDDSTALDIQDGRHPVVELLGSAALGSGGFVANSIQLEAQSPVAVITGPNMAGKSTFIRQTALLALLAQTGSFIPARAARIGVVDRIFTRLGAGDDITRGQSTFMVEMNETAHILNNATRRSLVILDEVGRGTSTFDGLSLAWAITEHIAEKIGARTLFATHYHELTAIEKTHPQVRNFNFAVKEWHDEIIFLRKIVPGAADRSYGIHVARLAGIPREVLQRSRAILANLEESSTDLRGRPTLAGPAPVRPLEISEPLTSGAQKGGPPAPERALQLDLFRDANAALFKEVKRLKIAAMTPLDALNYLAKLQQKIV